MNYRLELGYILFFFQRCPMTSFWATALCLQFPQVPCNLLGGLRNTPLFSQHPYQMNIIQSALNKAAVARLPPGDTRRSSGHVCVGYFWRRSESHCKLLCGAFLDFSFPSLFLLRLHSFVLPSYHRLSVRAIHRNIKRQFAEGAGR